MIELLPRPDGRTIVKINGGLWIERVSVPPVSEKPLVVFYDTEPLDGPIKGDVTPDDGIVLIIQESHLRVALDNLDGPVSVVEVDTPEEAVLDYYQIK